MCLELQIAHVKENKGWKYNESDEVYELELNSFLESAVKQIKLSSMTEEEIVRI